MAKFNSSEVVEALDYDLTAHAGPKGTVPEPSEAAIAKLFTRIRSEVAKEIESFGVTLEEEVQTPERLLELMSSFDEQKVLTAANVMTDIFGELCAGSPTKEQLKELPFRVRNAFFTWLMEELSPPGSSGGTTPSLRVVRAAPDGT
jgi:hypothetical protein